MRYVVVLSFLVGCIGGSASDTTPQDSGASADTGPASPATLLLVVDTSDSMGQSAMSLALGFDDVVAALPADTLVAITTMDVDAHAGDLVGPPTNDPVALATQLMCEATCFRKDYTPPSDPTHVCGDPLGPEVTLEWLDCTCGAYAWQENCGSALEEGLEALWLATCRADAAAPLTCTDNGLLDPADVGTLDLGTSVHAVLFSDEGDSSRRMDREEDAGVYVDLLASSGIDVTVSAVLPALSKGAVVCPGTATDWGVKRYLDAVEQTGGASADIYGDYCVPGDAAAALVSVLAP